MSDLLFIDSAWPVVPPPPSDGVCFYGGGDTPNIWSKAEVDAQPARFRLPIFTRSDPPGPGAVSDVAAMVAYLEYVGAPKGCLVAWDMETAADPSYMQQVYQGLRAAGYVLIDYGSQSSVFGNANPDGYYFGAEWTGQPHIAPGDQMTQYRALAAWDDDLASPLLPFWDTQPPPPAQEEPMFGPTVVPAAAGDPCALALPDGVTTLRFCSHAAAELRVDFFGARETEAVTLGYGQAPHVDLAGAKAVQVYRDDSGTNLVTVAGY